MIVDLHVHVVGGHRDRWGNHVSERLRRRWATRMFARQLGIDLKKLRAGDSGVESELRANLFEILDGCSLNRAVLLALDAIHDEDGTHRADATDLIVANGYVHDLARRHEKALFGASIHPYRADALQELERWAKKGAQLIKWIPSVQRIDLQHPRCRPFFELLAELKMPLLCHTGYEHGLPSVEQSLNRPDRLRAPLDVGVQVIAAHCGARLFVYERCFYSQWKKMALEYDNLFGDVSAFGLPTRIRYLRDIAEDARLHHKVFYGSDFPGLPHPWSLWLWRRVGAERYAGLRRIANPLDRNLQTIAAFELPEQVFSAFLEKFGGCREA